ncbi:hypothetical protein K4L44_06135 [Halosquirtibacter laminarini]|uniref:Uncharacterized protein n=1 Tax=Halosquirtibacter laminarini TaxID=3374600 RepID=A0AC61NP13_9BACT|nr:hypothetical protein K4L44_06135 [Prolixibacteraceae bacterium]
MKNTLLLFMMVFVAIFSCKRDSEEFNLTISTATKAELLYEKSGQNKVHVLLDHAYLDAKDNSILYLSNFDYADMSERFSGGDRCLVKLEVIHYSNGTCSVNFRSSIGLMNATGGEYFNKSLYYRNGPKVNKISEVTILDDENGDKTLEMFLKFKWQDGDKMEYLNLDVKSLPLKEVSDSYDQLNMPLINVGAPLMQVEFSEKNPYVFTDFCYHNEKLYGWMNGYDYAYPSKNRAYRLYSKLTQVDLDKKMTSIIFWDKESHSYSFISTVDGLCFIPWSMPLHTYKYTLGDEYMERDENSVFNTIEEGCVKKIIEWGKYYYIVQDNCIKRLDDNMNCDIILPITGYASSLVVYKDKLWGVINYNKFSVQNYALIALDQDLKYIESFKFTIENPEVTSTGMGVQSVCSGVLCNYKGNQLLFAGEYNQIFKFEL